MAYRGRALVELETTLGSDDVENEVTALETDDCIRVQVTNRSANENMNNYASLRC